MAASSHPPFSPHQRLHSHVSPAVHTLCQQSPSYASLFSLQNACLSIITSSLNLTPTPTPTHPNPLVVHALDTNQNAGAIAGCWQHPPTTTTTTTTTAAAPTLPLIRHLSASALANVSLSFGTTLLMALGSSLHNAPHFILELGLVPPSPSSKCSSSTGNTTTWLQGTLTLAQRSDIMLDVDYIERFYNSSAGGVEYSFNDIFNRFFKRQQQNGWRRYQVASAGVKPIIANSISYTFPADDVGVFHEACVDAAVLWSEHMLLLSRSGSGSGSNDVQEGVWLSSGEEEGASSNSTTDKYDERYRQVVLNDPGNQISERLFGVEATKQLLEVMLGK